MSSAATTGGSLQQLTALDASFLHSESNRTPMHIGPLMIYDMASAPGGFVRFKDILATFEQRLDRSKVFRRKLLDVPMELDLPYWVDDEDFDLEFHVRHIALPKPGDWRQLCIQCARLLARPMDRSRPLWEAYVIEGLDKVEGLPRGCFAILLKIHHAAIDGASGAEIIQAIHDLSPQPEPSARPAAWSPQPKPAMGSLLWKAYLNNVKQPLRVADVIRKGIPAWQRVREGERQRSFRRLGDKERTRFNSNVSAGRVFGGVDFPLQEVKSIKQRVEGATINDVILTVVSGGMRRYLEAKGEPPERSLVAGAPINIRDDSEQGTGGNLVSMMNIDLCSNETDPLLRLAAVHQAAIESKAYNNAVGARMLTDITSSIPNRVAVTGFRVAAQTGIMSRMKPTFNTIVTNVPGPQMPLYLGGAQLVRMYGTGPCMDNSGLFHPVVSYNGNMTISFLSCRELMPDPELYQDCLREAYDELLRAGAKRPAATRKKKAVNRKASAKSK